MIESENIKVIAFDADDTLWDCQSYFEKVENRLYDMTRPYCEDPAKELFNTESANMEDLGYGSKAFTISIIETALRVGKENITQSQLTELLKSCKELLHIPATPLPGVEFTLKALQGTDKKIVVFTKGELQDQENKLKRSGLSQYFSYTEITSNKSEKEFRTLCEHLSITPKELLMVGNSMKSDIIPALSIGSSAVYIPFHVTWQLEKIEEIKEHDNMLRINNMSEILPLFSI